VITPRSLADAARPGEAPGSGRARPFRAGRRAPTPRRGPRGAPRLPPPLARGRGIAGRARRGWWVAGRAPGPPGRAATPSGGLAAPPRVSLPAGALPRRGRAQDGAWAARGIAAARWRAKTRQPAHAHLLAAWLRAPRPAPRAAPPSETAEVSRGPRQPSSLAALLKCHLRAALSCSAVCPSVPPMQWMALQVVASISAAGRAGPSFGVKLPRTGGKQGSRDQHDPHSR
jgi:hypothetical protein